MQITYINNYTGFTATLEGLYSKQLLRKVCNVLEEKINDASCCTNFEEGQLLVHFNTDVCSFTLKKQLEKYINTAKTVDGCNGLKIEYVHNSIMID